METTHFKHIVGEVRTGAPATLRFYGKITEATAARFNEEFDYAESCSPSLIRVLINSEGGSVLHGMSVYSTIRPYTDRVRERGHGRVDGLGALGRRRPLADARLCDPYDPQPLPAVIRG